MSLAKAHLSGQVVSDIEKRFTQNNTAIASFSMVVQPASRGRNAEPFEIKVTCWSRLADAVSEQLSQGAFVVVEGKLTAPSVQQSDGSNKKSFEIEASTVSMLPSPPQLIDPMSAGDSVGGGYTPAAPQPQPQQQPVAAAAPAPALSAQPQQAPTQPMAQPAFAEDDIPF